MNKRKHPCELRDTYYCNFEILYYHFAKLFETILEETGFLRLMEKMSIIVKKEKNYD